MKLKKTNLIRIIFAFIGALIITLGLSLDVIEPTANKLSDAMYLTHQSPNSEIIIIGMDEKALSSYGQMPWSRDIMAKAIAQLNKDSSTKPAVIGIDTLYTIESTPEFDEQLVEAVKNGGNVVTASNITFGSELITLDDGTFYMDNNAVLLVEEPFDALKNVSTTGHLNAMLDTDGILRHAIWDITLPDGTTYPSFNQTIYKQYMQHLGLTPIASPPLDANNNWYVPFTSYPSSYYDGYSIADLVSGNLDADLFKDKIVLIGPYALGMSDEYITAIDHARKMFGVEYQANAIAALISGSLKTEILMLPQQFLLFILSFLALFFFYKKTILKLTITWVIASVAWVLTCLFLWQIGYVLHIFYVLTALSIAYITAVAYNYLNSTVEKSRITKTFKRYVAPQVVTKMLEQPNFEPQLGGKLTDIAVIFADIRGFTSLSEKLSPNEVATILNRYLSMMSKCVFKYGGTLDKFMGDCVMAFWGAPIEDETSALKAVSASLEMIKNAKELENIIYKTYKHKVSIGIGINFGPAVAGNFGAQDRMDYTVIGDTVNVASRLESHAKPNYILVSGAIYEMLKNQVEFSKIEEDIILKGKSQKVDIYKVEKFL